MSQSFVKSVQAIGKNCKNKSTSDYVLWKTNPGSGIQRGLGGENKNEGDEVKGHLFLMKYKVLWLTNFFCMD